MYIYIYISIYIHILNHQDRLQISADIAQLSALGGSDVLLLDDWMLAKPLDDVSSGAMPRRLTEEGKPL